jgi:aspartokinase
MKNTVGEVWKFLDNNPCIKRDLRKGLINSRALAKYIVKTQNMDVTLDAVISAIRRYDVGKKDDIFITARKLVSQTLNLSTRSGLAEISLIKDEDVQRSIPGLFDVIEYSRGEVLRVIQANESIKLIVDEKNLENVKTVFPKNKIINVNKNLAEINMHMAPKMIVTYGILAVIANELAINSVNILEVLTCLPEMILFVKEEDILKAYQILYQLCHPKN